ncbi:MAG: hypothetical protein AAFR20_09385 [Pseudomonadota bacterium]
MTNSNDNQLPDTITISWHIKDVLEVRPDLTDEQARKVLHHAKDSHDANCGINWDTLEIAAHALFPNAGD